MVKLLHFLLKNNIIVLGETGMNNTGARASTTCSSGTGKKKRVRGKALYSSGTLEVISKHQKKAGWVWWRNQAKVLAYSGRASWDSSVLGSNQSWRSNGGCNNCNYTNEVIVNDGYIGGRISNISFSFSHLATSDRSGICTTRR